MTWGWNTPHRPLPGAKQLLAVALAMLLVGCGPGADHYEAVLDELSIPAGWDLAHVTVRAPGGEIDCAAILTSYCPSVARYYLVDVGAAIDAYRKAKQLLLDAGLEIQDEFLPTCDTSTSGAACTVVAALDSDVVEVAVYSLGDDTEGLGIAQKGRSIVRVTARGK
jgi:hypothetical protein